MADVINHTVAIDYDTIENLNEGNEGVHEQWISVVTNHPDTVCLLIDGVKNKIVGYWHFVPLFEKEFQLAKQGKLYDIQITPDRVCFLSLPGLYKIYFVVISLLPEYRGIRNFRMLLDALCKQIIDLAEQDIFVEEICANAFTPEGIALCETLGMEHIANHEEYGRIYILRLLPPPSGLKLLQCHPRFADLYSRCRFMP